MGAGMECCLEMWILEMLGGRYGMLFEVEFDNGVGENVFAHSSNK